MLFDGFKFGMLLQLAIGPVCIFVFQTSVTSGFIGAEMAAAGAALVDGIEIALAVSGVSIILTRSRKALYYSKFFGIAILALFGLNMIISGLHISTLLPDYHITLNGGENYFIQAVLLTVSNPLTLVFWTGVFSVQLAKQHIEGISAVLFGCGCVLSTVFFLTVIAAVGNWAQYLFTGAVMDVLNIAVGLIMMYFSGKLYFKKSLYEGQ